MSWKTSLIVTISCLIATAIFFVMMHVVTEEEEEKYQQIENTYFRTMATVTEAGEVDRGYNSRINDWSQECRIEYKGADGKVHEIPFLARVYKVAEPVEVGDNMEIYVSPKDHKQVETVYQGSGPSLGCFGIMALGICVMLIIQTIIKYRNREEKSDIQGY